MSGKLLLQKFPPVTTAAWEELIRKDLKGADYAKTLIWQSEEGLAVKPYYRSEDATGLEHLESAPGSFPYTRGNRTSADWHIREVIEEAYPKKANEAARAALAAGAEEIEFRSVLIGSSADLDILFTDLNDARLHFHADESLLRLLISNRQTMAGSAGFDPLTNLDLAAKILAAPPAAFAAFTIDGGSFEESGATAAQEIGFTLAAGIDFLAAMRTSKIDINRAASSLTFSVAIGSSYFFQIAKLRAFRLLWARVVESFGGTPESGKARIHARTSRWNKTIHNPHANILRGTTEAMCAAIGGANSISVAPFEECYKAADGASRRLARNTQILLKKEAQLARVSDPGGGSYYLEAVTDFVASHGWKAMQAIEADGGFIRVRSSGKIELALKQSLAAREKAMAVRRRVSVAINHYPNPTEKVSGPIDSAKSSPKDGVLSGLMESAE